MQLAGCSAGMMTAQAIACRVHVLLPRRNLEMLLGVKVVFTCSGVGVLTAPQPATGLAEALSTEGGIGLDPVFQTWSYLWNINLNGEEEKYYNMTEVN